MAWATSQEFLDKIAKTKKLSDCLKDNFTDIGVVYFQADLKGAVASFLAKVPHGYDWLIPSETEGNANFDEVSEVCLFTRTTSRCGCATG